jgi:hypothetical protein
LAENTIARSSTTDAIRPAMIPNAEAPSVITRGITGCSSAIARCSDSGSAACCALTQDHVSTPTAISSPTPASATSTVAVTCSNVSSPGSSPADIASRTPARTISTATGSRTIVREYPSRRSRIETPSSTTANANRNAASPPRASSESPGGSSSASSTTSPEPTASSAIQCRCRRFSSGVFAGLSAVSSARTSCGHSGRTSSDSPTSIAVIPASSWSTTGESIVPAARISSAATPSGRAVATSAPTGRSIASSSANPEAANTPSSTPSASSPPRSLTSSAAIAATTSPATASRHERTIGSPNERGRGRSSASGSRPGCRGALTADSASAGRRAWRSSCRRPRSH